MRYHIELTITQRRWYFDHNYKAWHIQQSAFLIYALFTELFEAFRKWRKIQRLPLVANNSVMMTRQPPEEALVEADERDSGAGGRGGDADSGTMGE